MCDARISMCFSYDGQIKYIHNERQRTSQNSTTSICFNIKQITGVKLRVSILVYVLRALSIRFLNG